jgi:sugar fermentation stimulation protein A
LRELTDACREGYRAAIIFLVQMEGIKHFTPNRLMDPQFAEALAAAHNNGVEVLSYNCRISEHEIVINKKVEVV